MEKVLCFGAVLWDIIEGREYIGGAPFNLAGHLAKLGTQSSILTRVGTDRLGAAALKEIDRLGVDGSFIQQDAGRPTGTSTVTLDENRVPSYLLPDGTAYQFIESDDEILDKIRARQFSLFYFGTFEQKGEVSARSIYQVLESCSFRHVFLDVNIRVGFHPAAVLYKSLSHATILKLNNDEVELVAAGIYRPMSERELAVRLFADYPQLEVILVTKGAKGCTVYTRDKRRTYNECVSKAVDTVGAGDSFSAGFIHSYLKTGDAFDSTRFGNILADYVASRPGALPEYDRTLQTRLSGFSVVDPAVFEKAGA